MFNAFDELNALKFDEVPWERLFTAEGSGAELKNNLQKFLSANNDNCDKATLLSILGRISKDVEHQSSFFLASPFAFTFMAKRYKEYADKFGFEEANRRLTNAAQDKHETIEDLMVYLLISCLKYNLNVQSDLKPNPQIQLYTNLKDLLREEFLFTTEIDEETGQEVEVEPNFEDDMIDEKFYYSVEYYCYVAMSLCRPYVEKFLELENLGEIANDFCSEYINLLDENRKIFPAQ